MTIQNISLGKAMLSLKRLRQLKNSIVDSIRVPKSIFSSNKPRRTQALTILRLRSSSQTLNLSKGFTIVELLIVIVVIGILATVTMVAYSGVSTKAKIASLQSDLSSASTQIEMFRVTNPTNNYPTTIDCGIADSDTNKCIKASGSTMYTYIPLNNTNPKSFRLNATNNNISYYVTNTISPTIVSAPILTEPTAASITSTTATLGSSMWVKHYVLWNLLGHYT